jgi:hypothetical protein
VAVAERQVELAVGAHAELADGGLLERLETGSGEVDRGAEDRERQGQHRLVGGGVGARALPEGEGDGAGVLAHGDELVAGLDLPGPTR